MKIQKNKSCLFYNLICTQIDTQAQQLSMQSPNTYRLKTDNNNVVSLRKTHSFPACIQIPMQEITIDNETTTAAFALDQEHGSGQLFFPFELTLPNSGEKFSIHSAEDAFNPRTKELETKSNNPTVLRPIGNDGNFIGNELYSFINGELKKLPYTADDCYFNEAFVKPEGHVLPISSISGSKVK